ncbi:MAG: DNA-3-methyladenine glycosylase I [Myxococcota bacterium]
MKRCGWCGSDPLYVEYHDTEWGVPEYDDRALFEKLLLDGFQAGLSWITILKKRDNFRRAFHDFAPERMAAYGAKDLERLLGDKGIVRNRAKCEAAITSAQAYLRIMERDGGFSSFLWDFVDGQPIKHRYRTAKTVPAETPLSRQVSRALKQEGFRFVGPTIVYAFMQAVGMVNDHLTTCFRYDEV